MNEGFSSLNYNARRNLKEISSSIIMLCTIIRKINFVTKVEIEVFLKKKVYNKNITNNHITNYKEV
ncbi:hypothetical protein BCM0060_1633 [Bacillus cereus]|nr:hypothetical protein BCM0060_1633 [Bacillus cereus]BCC46332.1 hypothetical protein BCJMU02_1641 [Bacillus cereus]